ncbi:MULTISPECIES: methylation-associated defense system DNA methyltransferase MAD2 [unclassified Streptomyces]|uniref:methylation-associated defense system DNA methyltransferase MAD2 n=1 Tax=unclassified Streptomyces TaxID=2593676 RepID=UPI0021B04037|nr:N-6 DNA methylase [Streptomyces sp. WAC08241]
MEQLGFDAVDDGRPQEPLQDGTTKSKISNAATSLGDGELIDIITNSPVKDTPKEQVRQWVARALWHEYGIRFADMERDFPLAVHSEGGRRRTKKLDIAIFEPDAEHSLKNLHRVVVCKPEPKSGRAVTKIRTFEQANKDLDELKELMGSEEMPQIRYGLWTNGLDLFFLRKEVTRMGAQFEPRSDWPMADDSALSRSLAGTLATLRRGEAGKLKTAFRRCHNYVHGNEGMPKDAAFWQFLYLLFCKMHDERTSRASRTPLRLFAHPDEPFTAEGRRRIRERVLELFDEVKQTYALFTVRDEISLSDHALAFIVGELAPYNLSGTDIDVKGLAYQELVGTNLRGDRGQYFTPQGAVNLMVSILDPQEHETVLDPACGTGGFLRATLQHLLKQWKEAEGTAKLPDDLDALLEHQNRLREYADQHLFGADFDPFLVRATRMSTMLMTGAPGKVFHMDSLAFPHGHLSGVAEAEREIPLGSVDVFMSNPPFGTDIKIEETETLDMYRAGVARSFVRDKTSGDVIVADRPVTALAPEQLFIERSVQWVKEGGRIGLVLPNGILSNPGPVDEGIREWILENCWVLASIELPVETFIADANVNILTTVLCLKKKTQDEINTEALNGRLTDYPVFMAVAEKVGKDRRGKAVHKRRPDGEVILETIEEVERVGDEIRTVPRIREAVDDDLPLIAEAYQRFRAVHPEPGLPR